MKMLLLIATANALLCGKAFAETNSLPLTGKIKFENHRAGE